jgi:hypothetical protein
VMCLKTDEKKRKKKGQVWSVNIAWVEELLFY